MYTLVSIYIFIFTYNSSRYSKLSSTSIIVQSAGRKAWNSARSNAIGGDPKGVWGYRGWSENGAALKASYNSLMTRSVLKTCPNHYVSKLVLGRVHCAQATPNEYPQRRANNFQPYPYSVRGVANILAYTHAI